MALKQAAGRAVAPAIPGAIGGYRVLGVLGQGGMGIVYRGRDAASGTTVAIKTVRVPHESDLLGLRREIAALWRLRHPGIVRIVDQGYLRGCPWFAMELLRGSTLRRLNTRLWTAGTGSGDTARSVAAWPPPETEVEATTVSGRACPDPDAAAAVPQAGRRQARPAAAGGRLRDVLLLMSRLCGTLAYVHGNGFAHRDLKPTNVFLRDDGKPVLVDFGLVCRFPGPGAREALEPAGVRVGTVHYMAPEQIRADLVDGRADLYSLGCMLYEALTGQRPFEARSTEEVAEQQLMLAPTPPGVLVSGLPGALDDLTLRLLVKDPRERLVHAEEIGEELARLGRGDSAARGTAGAAPPPGRRRPAYFYRASPAGRRPLLAQIERAVFEGAHGRGRMILVGGERGMGKTFVLGQAVRQAALRDFRVVTTRSVPASSLAGADAAALDATGAPPHPIRSILRAVADCCRRGGEPLARRLLGPGARVLAAIEPSLQAFVPGRRGPAGAVAAPAPAPDEVVVAAVADTVTALAREQRVLIALDDLHWADGLTLAFLGRLRGAELQTLPLLVIGAHRPGAMPADLRAIVDSCGERAVPLPPLGLEAVTALVADLLAMEQPPADFMQALARQGHGNPARVIALLRAAVRQGFLARRQGRWVVAEMPAARPTARSGEISRRASPGRAAAAWTVSPPPVARSSSI